jgi:hypothetical protein
VPVVVVAAGLTVTLVAALRAYDFEWEFSSSSSSGSSSGSGGSSSGSSSSGRRQANTKTYLLGEQAEHQDQFVGGVVRFCISWGMWQNTKTNLFV